MDDLHVLGARRARQRRQARRERIAIADEQDAQVRAGRVDRALDGGIGSVVASHAIQGDHDLMAHSSDAPAAGPSALLVADFDDLAATVLTADATHAVGPRRRTTVRAAPDAIGLDGVRRPPRVATLTGGLALRNSHVAPTDGPPRAGRTAGRS